MRISSSQCERLYLQMFKAVTFYQDIRVSIRIKFTIFGFTWSSFAATYKRSKEKDILPTTLKNYSPTAASIQRGLEVRPEVAI